MLHCWEFYKSVSENVRDPITNHVLTHMCGKMPSGLNNSWFYSPHTKTYYQICTGPNRDRVFHAKHTNVLCILKDEKTNLISMLLQ